MNATLPTNPFNKIVEQSDSDLFGGDEKKLLSRLKKRIDEYGIDGYDSKGLDLELIISDELKQILKLGSDELKKKKLVELLTLIERFVSTKKLLSKEQLDNIKNEFRDVVKDYSTGVIENIIDMISLEMDDGKWKTDKENPFYLDDDKEAIYFDKECNLAWSLRELSGLDIKILTDDSEYWIKPEELVSLLNRSYNNMLIEKEDNVRKKDAGTVKLSDIPKEEKDKKIKEVKEFVGDKFDIPITTISDFADALKTIKLEKLTEKKGDRFGQFLRVMRYYEELKNAAEENGKYNIPLMPMISLAMVEGEGDPLSINRRSSGSCDGGAGLLHTQPLTGRKDLGLTLFSQRTEADWKSILKGTKYESRYKEYYKKYHGKHSTKLREYEDFMHGSYLQKLLRDFNYDYGIISQLDDRFHVDKISKSAASYLTLSYSTVKAKGLDKEAIRNARKDVPGWEKFISGIRGEGLDLVWVLAMNGYNKGPKNALLRVTGSHLTHIRQKYYYVKLFFDRLNNIEPGDTLGSILVDLGSLSGYKKYDWKDKDDMVADYRGISKTEGGENKRPDSRNDNKEGGGNDKIKIPKESVRVKNGMVLGAVINKAHKNSKIGLSNNQISSFKKKLVRMYGDIIINPGDQISMQKVGSKIVLNIYKNTNKQNIYYVDMGLIKNDDSIVYERYVSGVIPRTAVVVSSGDNPVESSKKSNGRYITLKIANYRPIKLDSDFNRIGVLIASIKPKIVLSIGDKVNVDINGDRFVFSVYRRDGNVDEYSIKI